MKMFGDMSSMASLLAAAMAANSANAAAAASASAKLPPLGANLNYAIPSSMLASLQQDLTNTNNTAQAAALAAAAFKYNSFYNSIDLLNAQKQQQQNYSTSLAKLMSYCYNKPTEYMQRLITEQTHNSTNSTNTFSPNSSSSTSQSSIQPIPLHFQSNLHTNKSNRYHPYNKPDLNASILKLHQQQQMTINTNSQQQHSSSSQLSPDTEFNAKKRYDSPTPPTQSALNSRSPSPVESLSNQSVRNQNNISRPSSTLSSESIDLKTNE